MRRITTVIAAVATSLSLMTPSAPATTPAPSIPAVGTAAEPGTGYRITTLEPVVGYGTDSFPATPCDDCTTPIEFPFPLTFYGQTYTGGYISSNGNLQFTGNTPTASTGCLPNAELGAAIMPREYTIPALAAAIAAHFAPRTMTMEEG